MSNTYTTSDLIDDILMLAHTPGGNNTFTSTNLLKIANMELQTPIVKQILSTRGGYYLNYVDISPNATGLYSIPSDAIAGTIVSVETVDGTSINQVSQYESSEQFSTLSPMSVGSGFFIRGNHIQILPIPTDTVRLWFNKRPSNLILTSKASQIAAINGAVLTVNSIPSSIQIGSGVDVLGDQPPFHILGDTLTITDISGTDITLSGTVDNVSVSDWIALHNQTPIPQIPVEFRVLLAQRVVVKINEMQGYTQKFKEAQAKLLEYENNTLNLIAPRVKSKTKIITSNVGGFLRKGRIIY